MPYFFAVSDFPSTDDEIDQTPIFKYLPIYDIDDLVDTDEEKSGYQEYVEENFLDFVSNYYETEDDSDDEFHYHLPLNRDEEIFTDREDYPDLEYARVFEETIYLPEDNWFSGQPVMNKKLFKYRFSTLDIESATKNPDSLPSKYTIYEAYEIYPDTTVWIKDFMLTFGLLTEAVIFTIAGVRGYVLLKDNNVKADATDVSDVSKEANELKLAYQNATTKLTSLGKNLSKVVDSTSAIDIPSDISSNMATLNENVSKTSKALDVLEKAYVNTEKAVATEPAAHEKVVENMNQLQSELSNLKKTVASLNAKYAEVLGAMKK